MVGRAPNFFFIFFTAKLARGNSETLPPLYVDIEKFLYKSFLSYLYP